MFEQVTSFARGMNDVAAPTDYLPDEVRLLENGRPSFAGSAVERRAGTRNKHATGVNSGARCWGAWEHVHTDGARHWVGVFGTKVYRSTDKGGTWTEVTATTAPTAGWWSAASMRTGSSNYLMLANGGSKLWYYDGSTTLGESDGPGTGVEFLAVFNDRLYAAGHDGVTVAASVVNDPLDWSASAGAFTIRAQTHEGEPELRGLYAHAGALLVFKRKSTNYVEGFGVRTIQVEAGPRGISRSVGCMGHRTIVAVGDQAVMWLSERGFEYWTPGGGITLVSRPMQNFIDELAWDAIADDPLLPCAIYYARRYEYWCAVPIVGASNTAIYVHRPPQSEGNVHRPPANYVVRRGDLVKGQVGQIDADGYDAFGPRLDSPRTYTITGGYEELNAVDDLSGVYAAISDDGYLELANLVPIGQVLFTGDTVTDIAVPHEGTNDGFVAQMETGDKDGVNSDGTGGMAVKMRVRGRPFLHRDPLKRTWSRELRATFAGRGTASVTTMNEADGVPTSKHTHDLKLMGPRQPQTVRVRTTGVGRTQAPVIETADAVQLQALEIGVRPLRRV